MSNPSDAQMVQAAIRELLTPSSQPSATTPHIPDVLTEGALRDELCQRLFAAPVFSGIKALSHSIHLHNKNRDPATTMHTLTALLKECNPYYTLHPFEWSQFIETVCHYATVYPQNPVSSLLQDIRYAVFTVCRQRAIANFKDRGGESDIGIKQRCASAMCYAIYSIREADVLFRRAYHISSGVNQRTVAWREFGLLNQFQRQLAAVFNMLRPLSVELWEKSNVHMDIRTGFDKFIVQIHLLHTQTRNELESIKQNKPGGETIRTQLNMPVAALLTIYKNLAYDEEMTTFDKRIQTLYKSDFRMAETTTETRMTIAKLKFVTWESIYPTPADRWCMLKEIPPDDEFDHLLGQGLMMECLMQMMSIACEITLPPLFVRCLRMECDDPHTLFNRVISVINWFIALRQAQLIADTYNTECLFTDCHPRTLSTFQKQQRDCDPHAACVPLSPQPDPITDTESTLTPSFGLPVIRVHENPKPN